MGRKPTRWMNLPKGMRARPRGNLVHYYLDTGAKPRREIALGSDYVQAVAKWAELTAQPVPVRGTFVEVWNKYKEVVLPTKAPRTQQDNAKESVFLLRFFGDPPARRHWRRHHRAIVHAFRSLFRCRLRLRCTSSKKNRSNE